MSKYKLPFKIKMTDPKSQNAMEEVVNPYSGEKCELTTLCRCRL